MLGKYILKGHTVILVKDTLEWGRWFEKNQKKKIVKQEELPNGYFVSTVFPGIDYNFSLSENHIPILFETMVFPTKGNFDEQDMERYSTWEEAEKGHKKMVKKWLKKKPYDPTRH